MLCRVLKPHDTNGTLSIVITSHRWDTDGRSLSPRPGNLWVIRRGTTRHRKLKLCFSPWSLGAIFGNKVENLFRHLYPHPSLWFSLTLLPTSLVHLQPVLWVWLNDSSLLGAGQDEFMQVVERLAYSDISVDLFYPSALVVTVFWEYSCLPFLRLSCFPSPLGEHSQRDHWLQIYFELFRYCLWNTIHWNLITCIVKVY